MRIRLRLGARGRDLVLLMVMMVVLLRMRMVMVMMAVMLMLLISIGLFKRSGRRKFVVRRRRKRLAFILAFVRAGVCLAQRVGRAA